MLFSMFSGTRFQTNLKKIRQIQTNFRRYLEYFPENVSDLLTKCVWEISFSPENLSDFFLKMCLWNNNISRVSMWVIWPQKWMFTFYAPVKCLLDAIVHWAIMLIFGLEYWSRLGKSSRKVLKKKHNRFWTDACAECE